MKDKDAIKERKIKEIASLSDLSITEKRKELWELLGSDSWRLRKAAQEKLMEAIKRGLISSDSAFQEIYRGLQDEENASRRNASIELLVELIDVFRPMIIERLAKERNHQVLKFLVDVAGLTRTQEAVPYLRRFLSHEDPNVRFSSIEALGHIGTPSAKNVLLRKIKTGCRKTDVAEIYAVIEALTAMGTRGVSLNPSHALKFMENSSLEPVCLRYLGATGKPAVFKHIFSVLRRTDKPISVREGIKSVVRLLLLHPHRNKLREDVKRYSAALDMGFITESFEDALDEDKLFLLRFLSFIERKEFFERMLEIAEEIDAELEKKASAFSPLSEASYPLLINSSRRANLRLLAMKMAQINKASTCLDIYLESLFDADPEIRKTALDGLMKTGNERAFDFIIEKYAELLRLFPKPLLHTALFEIGKKYPAFAMKKLSSVSEELSCDFYTLIIELATLSKRVPKWLIDKIPFFTNHPDREIREKTAIFLSKTEDRNLPKFLDVLRVDEDPYVRKEAYSGLLARAKNEQLLPIIKSALNDANEWVKVLAIEHLHRLPPKSAFSIASSMLKDRSPIVALKAFEVLKELKAPLSYFLEGFLNSEEEFLKSLFSFLSERKGSRWVEEKFLAAMREGKVSATAIRVFRSEEVKRFDER